MRQDGVVTSLLCCLDHCVSSSPSTCTDYINLLKGDAYLGPMKQHPPLSLRSLHRPINQVSRNVLEHFCPLIRKVPVGPSNIFPQAHAKVTKRVKGRHQVRGFCRLAWRCPLQMRIQSTEEHTVFVLMYSPAGEHD